MKKAAPAFVLPLAKTDFRTHLRFYESILSTETEVLINIFSKLNTINTTYFLN